MSGSFPVFDSVVRHLVGLMTPVRALDVGAGAGKFGQIVRAAAPACDTTALECRPDVVERFGLRDLYRRVEVADATRWWQANVDEMFDLVVAGDVLQHLPKSEGLDLLNAMVHRAAWLVVIVPEFVVQNAVEGSCTSIHRSVWSERDMQWHDLWAWDNTRASTLLLLRGYQSSPVSIEDIVRQVNGSAIPLLDFDGDGVVRPCRLRLVDHGREVAYRPR